MSTTRVTFLNSRALTLVGLLDKPDTFTGPLPAVVICHGFTGFKEVKYLARLAQALRDAGFASLRFDFSGCIGESQGRCEDMSLTHQVNDTIAALDFLEDDPDIDKKGIGLAGHSLGGLACIAVAATDRRVKALVTIASPARADWQRLFDPATVAQWEQQGTIDIPTYTRGHVRMHYHFLEDFREYDATRIIRNVHAPVRFIHGLQDDLVPPRNAQALYENASSPKDLTLLEGADHLFLDSAVIRPMVKASVEWFQRYLRAEGPATPSHSPTTYD